MDDIYKWLVIGGFVMFLLLIIHLIYKKCQRKPTLNKSCLQKNKKNKKSKTVTFNPIVEYVLIPPIQ